ncbi:MAG: dynamin family protein [Chloroflexota bacterium]
MIRPPLDRLDASRARLEAAVARARAPGSHPEWLRRVDAVLERLDCPTVSVAFAGHFSCGKSSLINLALGRSLLPTGDLPETGVPCVISAGERDRVTVWRGGTPNSIPCDAESIRREIALVAEDGEERASVREIDRLEITVEPGSIPADARWLDTPGIDDTAAMSERARQTVDEADALVWVIDARQPLAEVEVAFIARHVATFGADALVFAINLFLSEDPDESWRDAVDRRAPYYFRKLADQAWRLGIDGPELPETVVVSARAALASGGRDFGGSDFTRLLDRLATTGHPGVQAGRTRRAIAAVEDLIARTPRMMPRPARLPGALGMARPTVLPDGRPAPGAKPATLPP